MDNKLLLVKCVTLLYRENQLPIKAENSIDLIRTGIESIKTQGVELGLNTEKDTIQTLKETVIEMCNNGQDHDYDKVTLLQRLKLNCGNDEKLYEALEQGVDQELIEGSLKRTIINLRKSITNHFKEEKVGELLAKADYLFKYKRESIKDISQFLMEHISQLEPLRITSVAKDSAILSEVDIGDIESISKVFEEIKSLSTNEGIMVTGYQDINKMLQGGFRRGEFWRVDALQHKNKTGFTLSLFAQFALFNKPYMLDPNKKPLLLRISFEDELHVNLKYLYTYLKVRAGCGIDDIPESTTEEMSLFIKEKLGVNGYQVKLLRVDPGKWTYLHVCNKIIELEAQGYEVHVCMLDYLSKLPTTGCSIGGPMGSDHHDLHNRIRNFFAARKTICITPHQLSSEANQLLREGRQDFVKTIVGLNYTEKSKTLEQVPDGSMIIHIEKFQKESWFTVVRGKHRGVDVIPDEDKYVVYKFPKRGPILDDLGRENTAYRRVGGTINNIESEGEFSSSVL